MGLEPSGREEWGKEVERQRGVRPRGLVIPSG